MSNVIQIKRKTTSGAPSLGVLAVGEMCLVIPDKVLYQKLDASTLIVVNNEIGTLYNQATEPTGIGTQLPDTASFEANTDMMLYQSTINGVLRYFWVKL